MKEQDLQRNIIKYLESIGYYVVKVVTASKSGVPDLLCCAPGGKFCAIEVKAPGKLKNTSALQVYNLEKINVCGGEAIVVDDLQTIKETFK